MRLRFIAGFLTFFPLAVVVRLGAAPRQVLLDSERIAWFAEKRNAVQLGRGRIAATATDSLASLAFNPSLLTNTEGVAFEVNTNTLGNDLVLYQNLWAFPTRYGNFSVGYSLLDGYENYLRFNQFYDYSLTYSFEVIPGVFGGVGFVADPFRQALSAGITVPLKTNIRIWKNLGVFGIVYGGSVWNISLQKSDIMTLPGFLTHGFSFTFLSFKYLRAENFIEFGVSQDFLQRSFHEGVSLVFCDALFLSAGMHGNDLMKLSVPTYGAGIDLRRGYTSFRLFYAEEQDRGTLNRALTLAFSLRLSGKPASGVTGTVSTPAISPRNADGIQDVVFFRFSAATGAARSWKLIIRNSLGEAVRTIEQSGEIRTEKKMQLPGELTWNGRDDFNNYVADGVYFAHLLFLAPDYQPYYLNLPEVTVDNTPPSVLVSAPSDEIKIRMDEESEYGVALSFRNRQPSDTWTIRIVSETGIEIDAREFSGIDVPDSYAWDLRDSSGRKIRAGKYSVIVEARDDAFNTMPRVVVDFHVAYQGLSVTLRALKEALSPAAQRAEFIGAVETAEKIRSWTFAIRDGASRSIHETRGAGAPPPRLYWPLADGKKNVPDGFYFGYLTVTYEGEVNAESHPVRLEIDSIAPDARISHAPPLFSPDGDGIEEYVSFTVDHGETTPIQSWSLEITEAGAAQPMRIFSGLGNPPSEFRWDGTSDSGQLVKSLQRYTYRLSLKDRAGNRKVISGGVIDVDFLIFNLGNELRVQTFGILFDKVQAKMDGEFYAKLDRIVQMSLHRLKDFDLTIEGHGDMYGSDELNYAIAEKRAKLIYDYIVQKAPELSSRIRYKGYGKERLIYTEDDPRLQRLNRRVEFYFFKREKKETEEKPEPRSES